MPNEHATPPPSTNSWNGLRRCFSTLGCAELSLEEIGGICTRMGLDKIELRGIDDTLNLPAWFAERFELEIGGKLEKGARNRGQATSLD